ncbi:MAG: response regulator [Chitinophagaceae bacterium]|jgi:response regulator RpfG family c-di-GMP phosphodiesterase
MKLTTHTEIVFIDDDRLSNMICTKILKVIFPEHPVISFTHPKEGLKYLSGAEVRSKGIILFLDINMPGLSGWALLEELGKLSQPQDNPFTIYVLSSTLNSEEMEKAENHPLVKAYVPKPLSIEIFRTLIS